MATQVAFCPLFNGQAVVLPNGAINSGGLINTYLAGTSTPASTWTDSGGTSLNTNPIQLGPDGWAPSEIWLQAGIAYKLVVTDALGGNSKTYDNIIAAQGGNIYPAQVVQTIYDAGGFIAQLLTSAGYSGFRSSDQIGTRKVEYIYWGTASTPTYGMAVNGAGVNTSNSVSYSIGTNDTVRMFFSASSNDITAVGVDLVRKKSIATSRPSTTTFADDPDLIVPLAANTLYNVRLWMPVYATTGGAGGFKFQMAYSGTLVDSEFSANGLANGAAAAFPVNPVSTSVTLGATIVATAGNAGADWVLITGAVRTTTAGNLSFQWAQVASNANAANVGAGAFIEAKKAV